MLRLPLFLLTFFTCRIGAQPLCMFGYSRRFLPFPIGTFQIYSSLPPTRHNDGSMRRRPWGTVLPGCWFGSLLLSVTSSLLQEIQSSGIPAPPVSTTTAPPPVFCTPAPVPAPTQPPFTVSSSLTNYSRFQGICADVLPCCNPTYCSSYPNEMRTICPVTCGYCTGTVTGGVSTGSTGLSLMKCSDALLTCPQQKSLCTSPQHKERLRKQCAYTCGYCTKCEDHRNR